MKRREIERLIYAMRASAIVAPQDKGLWYIQRVDLKRTFNLSFPELMTYLETEYAYHRYPDLPRVTTSLLRWTDATIHLGRGECVMSDDPRELARHLPIVLRAHGRVLVTGLGLGCVVRGLLAQPRVEHIDVIEIDRDVLDMVGGLFTDPRVTLHEGDAVTYRWPSSTRWDFAWHDVWSDRPDTQVLHGQLLFRYRDRTTYQGAWQFPREFKRIIRPRGQLVG